MDLRCVVIGPPKCGKTTLITKYMTGRLPDLLDNSLVNYNINLIYHDEVTKSKNWNFSTSIVDHELYLDNDEFNNIDVLILCFDISSKESFKLLQRFYDSSIKTRWSDVPKLLVGNLCDLLVSDDAGTLEKISIDDYEVMKCSALDSLNVDRIFEKSFKLAAEKFIMNQKIEFNIFQSEISKLDLVDNIEVSMSLNKKRIVEIPILNINSKNECNYDDSNVANLNISKRNDARVELNEFENIPQLEKTLLISPLMNIKEKRYKPSQKSVKIFKTKRSFLLILAIISILIITMYCCKDNDTFLYFFNKSKGLLKSFNNYFNELVIHAAEVPGHFL
jgi:GTPase SAR1 family protein